jgi:hypothetical protein
MSLKTFLSRLHDIFIGSPPMISITLNDRIGPIDRGLTYEDPIDEYLKRMRFGKVIGGGTFQQQSGEISGCDIHIQLSSIGNNNFSIASIISEVENLGAPKGSKLTFDGTKKEVAIGKLEGLAIYIDAESLPAAVYESSDINFVISEISTALAYKGEAGRNWQGAKETALYYYDKSYEQMKASIMPFVSSYPLCKNSRIVQIA